MIPSKLKLPFSFVTALCLGPLCLNAQDLLRPMSNVGINGGLHINLGTHIDRVGFVLSGYYHIDFVQFNAESRLNFNFQNLGPKGRGVEKQLGVGVVFGTDRSGDFYNRFPGLTSNQMESKYSVGYGHKFYFDKMGTSQRTGLIGIQIGDVDVVHENDVLAKRRSDKFRTAALLIGYRHNDARVGINTILWTGNPTSRRARKISTAEFARFGYVDLSRTKFGHLSHGILSIQYDHAFDYGQTLTARIGIDSEHVRNAFQNKLIHDLPFWPMAWNKAKNQHIPMLDEEGRPYLYLKGQVVKRPRLHLNIGLNPDIFY